MSKDYKKVHQQKLADMKKRLLGSTISDKLELKAISNAKIDEVIVRMNKILAPRQVWDDFSFRTGRLMGIMRSIAQNPKMRKDLLEATGLTQDYVDLYFEVCGNLPYLNTSDNSVNIGRPMKVEETKEYITLLGLHFGYVIEESDLSDIIEERWERLYNNALEKITETAKHNAEHSESVPQGGYEE